MSYNIIPTDNFNREAKKLAKKHRSLKSDLIALRKELLENPTKGTHLGSSVYKIRMAIASKGKGKSGGARIISYVLTRDEEIYLLSIYDKSEQDSISDDEIKELIKQL
jgi:mRNA-degrading endonuclease RelE of RelBE toxin-antitoxin system